MQKEPSGFVGTYSKLPLQFRAGDSFLGGGYQIDRPEELQVRMLESVKHGTSGNRRLSSAGFTLKQLLVVQKIIRIMIADRASESVRPPEMNKVFETGFFGGKTLYKVINGQDVVHDFSLNSDSVIVYTIYYISHYLQALSDSKG
jgi:hypothetical protein